MQIPSQELELSEICFKGIGIGGALTPMGLRLPAQINAAKPKIANVTPITALASTLQHQQHTNANANLTSVVDKVPIDSTAANAVAAAAAATAAAKRSMLGGVDRVIAPRGSILDPQKIIPIVAERT